MPGGRPESTSFSPSSNEPDQGAGLVTPSVLAILERVGAIIINSHIVYTSGQHGSSYVNKDALYAHPQEMSLVCRHLAERFVGSNIQVVAGQTVSGALLAQWVAYHLGILTRQELVAVYAEEQGVIGQRVFRRGFGGLLANKRVLVVEDVLTTGGAVRKVVAAVQAAGGCIVGIGAVCNRGDVTATGLGVPLLHALVDVPLEAWDEAQCPLCQAGVPINTLVGRGAAFVAGHPPQPPGDALHRST